MIDGFLSILAVMIFLLLLWGEWFEEIAQEMRLKKIVITFYLLSFLLFSQWIIPIGDGFLGLGLLFFPIPLFYFVKRGGLSIPHLLGNSLILAAVIRTLEEILYNDPVLMIVKEPWMSAFATGLIIALLSRKALEAIGTLFLGFLFLEAYAFLLPMPQEEALTLFPAYVMDLFFLSLLFLPFDLLLIRNLFDIIFGTGEREKMKKDVRM